MRYYLSIGGYELNQISRTSFFSVHRLVCNTERIFDYSVCKNIPHIDPRMCVFCTGQWIDPMDINHRFLTSLDILDRLHILRYALIARAKYHYSVGCRFYLSNFQSRPGHQNLLNTTGHSNVYKAPSFLEEARLHWAGGTGHRGDHSSHWESPAVHINQPETDYEGVRGGAHRSYGVEPGQTLPVCEGPRLGNPGGITCVVVVCCR